MNDKPELIIEIIAGQSGSRPAIVFRGGVPALPVVVGSNASWRVLASGVAPKHVALAFNGETLFVTSLDHARARVNGADIRGRGWVRAPSGTAIDFGEARLLVTMTTQRRLLQRNSETVALPTDDAVFSSPRLQRPRRKLIRLSQRSPCSGKS